MTEERKKEILKTIEERISSIPEKYVSKVIADWFFCSGEEDLMKSPPPCADITPMEVVSNSRAEPQS